MLSTAASGAVPFPPGGSPGGAIGFDVGGDRTDVRFGAVPPVGSPGGAIGANVGTATFTFAHGNSASFTYTVKLGGTPDLVTQTKTITREVFVAPGTVCQ